MKKYYSLVLVLVIVFLVYFPSLFYYFVSDDFYYLARIKTSQSLKETFNLAWEPMAVNNFWRPLSWAPFFLGRLLKDNLAGYHFLSVFFHLANTLLVYLLAQFLFKNHRAATLTALIFGVHPINAEVVCHIAIFADVCLVFFSLLSLILFGQFYLTTKRRYYLGSLFCLVAALLAKEAAPILPGLVCLVIIFLNGERKERFLAKLYLSFPYFLLVVLYLLVRPSGLPDLGSLSFDFGKLYRVGYFFRGLAIPIESPALKSLIYPVTIFLHSLIGGLGLSVIFLFFFLTRKDSARFRVLVMSLSGLLMTMLIPLFLSILGKRHLYFPLLGYSLFLVGLFSPDRRKCFFFFFIFLIAGQIYLSSGRNDLYRYAGQFVRENLNALKKNVPEFPPESVVYLVGIPGMVENTFVLVDWGEDAVRFTYAQRNLAVYSLSPVIFTKESFPDQVISFSSEGSFTQSMETDCLRYFYLRNIKESEDGQWIKISDQTVEVKVIERNKWKQVEKVAFRFDKELLSGKKIYLIGPLNGKMKLLKIINL